MNIPEGYSLLADADQVETNINAIAARIIIDFPEGNVLFVTLLRGANPFAAQLMHAIVKQSREFHPEMDYMMVSTYGNDKQAGEPHIVTDLAPTTQVRGRDVIIVDDVLDKGVTADFVTRHLQARGAANVHIAVLCDKATERRFPIEATYVGFHFKDNWLVGMGMDDADAATEGYRWLDEIWEIAR